MNNSICDEDIGGDDFGGVDVHGAVDDGDCDLTSSDGGEGGVGKH